MWVFALACICVSACVRSLARAGGGLGELAYFLEDSAHLERELGGPSAPFVFENGDVSRSGGEAGSIVLRSRERRRRRGKELEDGERKERRRGRRARERNGERVIAVVVERGINGRERSYGNLMRTEYLVMVYRCSGLEDSSGTFCPRRC